MVLTVGQYFWIPKGRCHQLQYWCTVRYDESQTDVEILHAWHPYDLGKCDVIISLAASVSVIHIPSLIIISLCKVSSCFLFLIPVFLRKKEESQYQCRWSKGLNPQQVDHRLTVIRLKLNDSIKHNIKHDQTVHHRAILLLCKERWMTSVFWVAFN